MFERMGWKGLLALVWYSTPFPKRLVSLPYGMVVYRKFLASSKTLDEVRVLHLRKCQSSRVFRALRPRFRRARYLLI